MFEALDATATGVKFDDFTVYDGASRDPVVPGFDGLADMSISAGEMLVTGGTRRVPWSSEARPCRKPSGTVMPVPSARGCHTAVN